MFHILSVPKIFWWLRIGRRSTHLLHARDPVHITTLFVETKAEKKNYLVTTTQVEAITSVCLSNCTHKTVTLNLISVCVRGYHAVCVCMCRIPIFETFTEFYYVFLQTPCRWRPASLPSLIFCSR